VGFAVVERQLKPGRTADYLRAVGELCRLLNGSPGLLGASTYVDAEASGRALNLQEWRTRADLDAARANGIADHLRAQLIDCVAPGGDPDWLWFEKRYLVKNMARRTGYCSAVRFQVDPADVGAYLDWTMAEARRALEGPELVGLAVLERAEAPGQLLALEEYQDEAARDAHLASRSLREVCPARLTDVRTFRGATGHHWELDLVGLA
jgi:quinol monooxygenase YgiN